MSDRDRVRVVLRWIQILDTKEPFFKKAGEFRFVTRVTGTGAPVEKKIPEKGHLSISESFMQNKVTFDTVIFEGEVDEELSIVIQGEEIDLLSKNDQLPPYRREFVGAPTEWIGWYGPGDETPGDDPENMEAWRVCYRIEAV